MNEFLDEHAYIIYPSDYIDNNLKMIIYLSDSDLEKQNYLKFLQKNYNIYIQNCYIGDIHKMIIIQNNDLISLLIDLYSSNKKYRNGIIYKEFLKIYKNKEKYINL